jgi:uncharacterized SAM-binding protein YcdF (DUF218 family)
MDILLKKFISFFLMPFPIAVVLLLVGLFFLYRHRLFYAKLFLSIGMGWLFLISYAPFSNHLLYAYESQTPTLHEAPQETEYIYLLGGGHDSDESLPITSQISPVSMVRFAEALRLYRQITPRPTLILSGYGGFDDPNSHALMLQKLALSLGVDKSDLYLAPNPRDTQEEAQVAKEVIGKEPFILVTSASHMPRALKFFHAEGLYPTPAPTYHEGDIKHLNYFKEIYSISSMEKLRMLWHEILGTWWQTLKASL